MFFTYVQNNSGGGFHYEDWQVTEYVVIEAMDADEADVIAGSVGIYFDPNCLIDCECCGSRWGQAYLGDDLPSVWGEPVWRKYAKEPSMISFMGEKPETFVHYKDGTVEAWQHGKPVNVLTREGK